MVYTSSQVNEFVISLSSFKIDLGEVIDDFAISDYFIFVGCSEC